MKTNLHNLAASIRTLLGNVQAHLSDNSKHITTDERNSWNNKTNDSKIASATELGHVKVGENLTIDTDGKLSASAPAANAPIATNSTPGIMRPNGTELTVTDAGTLNVRSASTSQQGIVQLNNSTSSNSTVQAPTANALKDVADIANAKYTKPASGIPKTDLSSEVQTALNNAGGSLPAASTTRAGIVMLDNSLASTSETTAVTSKAMKDVVDAVLAMDARIAGKAGTSSESWKAASLANNWTGTVLYRKDNVGTVHVHVDVYGGIGSPGYGIFTLPAGYRSNFAHTFPLGTAYSGDSGLQMQKFLWTGVSLSPVGTTSYSVHGQFSFRADS